ncbi:phosphodiester glycosidase family protein (plasmid) [Streptomyces sp. BHT-5-2]|uniref:phosphodiester glycosidase family protein n=1 Tax=Streptomyces sp. BHT-5-2 TaxID=2866715 RepID=UPI001C8D2D11|nr:phosphodiester glycosidase family protein [Streptomyces sp. BHT-5-2]QZL07218.1 phosphodiester glycosidase family protein [Streptomyces sp. BHT-5-2]
MKQLLGKFRTVAALTVAWGVLAGGTAVGATRASADGGFTRTPPTRLARGVTYSEFRMFLPRGIVHGHLLTVNLSDPAVSVDLLHPAAVAARAPVSELADDRDAVGAVNGDFFDISEAQHPEAEVTGSSVGPAVASGRELKAAVPDGQRFGPALPPGATTKDVLAVGYDHRARLDRLTLRGTVRSHEGSWPLRGLNQYALPQGGIGAYTARWGAVSRERAVCGTDTDRGAGCDTDTAEITIRHGRVAHAAAHPGTGVIERGSVVLVGREQGARRLRALHLGERVFISHRLVARLPGRLRCAVGGFPVLRHGRPAAGLDAVAVTMRTSIGIADRGRTLLLMALDGEKGKHQTGLTVRELAGLMSRLGAREAMDLDGGGSSTFVTQDPYGEAKVRNHPTVERERPVANAVGVFSSVEGIPRGGSPEE